MLQGSHLTPTAFIAVALTILITEYAKTSLRFNPGNALSPTRGQSKAAKVVVSLRAINLAILAMTVWISASEKMQTVAKCGTINVALAGILAPPVHAVVGEY